MIFRGPTILDGEIATFHVADFGQPAMKRGHSVIGRTVGSDAKITDHRYCRLLRARRERPRHRAAKPRDELPSPHWITSSAVANSVSGIVRPSAFAVLRLMTNSNLVACSMGRSAGLVPLRILSTKA